MKVNKKLKKDIEKFNGLEDVYRLPDELPILTGNTDTQKIDSVIEALRFLKLTN